MRARHLFRSGRDRDVSHTCAIQLSRPGQNACIRADTLHIIIYIRGICFFHYADDSLHCLIHLLVMWWKCLASWQLVEKKNPLECCMDQSFIFHEYSVNVTFTKYTMFGNVFISNWFWFPSWTWPLHVLISSSWNSLGGL